jgi:hypothetical protein
MGLRVVRRGKLRIVLWVLMAVLLLSAALAGVLLFYYRPTIEWVR